MQKVQLARTDDSALSAHGASQVLKHLGLSFQISNVECLELNSNFPVTMFPDGVALGQDFNSLYEYVANGACIIKVGSIESETDVDALFGVKSRGFRPTKPPEIGGWMRFHKRQSIPEHDVPFFFGFTPCVSVGHSEVNGTVLDFNKAKTKTPAIVIHRIGRGMTAWISSNLFESVGYLLAGGEATLQEDRGMRMDEYGRIPGINSVMYKYGLVNTPLVNEYEAIIWNIICQYHQITGIPGVQKWLWPDGKSFAMFSSHDVDHFLQPPHLLLLRSLRDLLHLKIKKGLIQLLLSMLYLPGSMGYFYGRADLLKFIPTELFHLMDFDPWLNFEKIVKYGRDMGTVPTFFFLNNSSKRDSTYALEHPFTKKIIKNLDRHGCEIGLHGSFHSYNHQKQLQKEKELLESILNKKVRGVRQHRARFIYPETWRIQEKVGFTYDSTDFFNDVPGFRSGVCLPYEPFDTEEGREISILELPLTIMDLALVGGREFDPSEALESCKKLADTTIERNGLLALLWHLSSFDEEVFRLERRLRKRFDRGFFRGEWIFRNLVKHCFNRDGWFATGGQIAEWWRKRDNVKMDVIDSKGRLDVKLYSNDRVKGFTLRFKMLRKPISFMVSKDFRWFKKGEDAFVIVDLPAKEEVSISTRL